MNFWENKIGDIEIGQGLSSVVEESSDKNDEISKIGHLSIDVYQDKDSLVLLAPLSGVNEKDLSLKLQDEVLTIVARRSIGDSLLTADFMVKECYWGEVRRAIVLPEGLDLENIDAEIDQGVLKVVIPKLSKKKVKKIVI
jgi:HSP20 family protein